MLIMSFIGQMIHLSMALMFWRLSESESLSGKERPLILNNHKISRLYQSFLKSALLALSQSAIGGKLKLLYSFLSESPIADSDIANSHREF